MLSATILPSELLRRCGYSLIYLGEGIPDMGGFTWGIEASLDWKPEQDIKESSKDAQRGLWHGCWPNLPITLPVSVSDFSRKEPRQERAL